MKYSVMYIRSVTDPKVIGRSALVEASVEADLSFNFNSVSLGVSKMSRELVIPEFWEFIETNLNLEPKGIQTIKEVLTLLDYTTIQSVSKLSQKKEIALIELEFKKLKESNPDFALQYPNLSELKFGSGFKTILGDIANKIKRRYSSIDFDSVRQKTFKAISIFCKEILESHISIKVESGNAKCIVQCPKCYKNYTLNPYWTKTGQEFRVGNFQRHIESHDNINKVQEQNDTIDLAMDSGSCSGLMRSQLISQSTSSSVRRSGDSEYWKLCDTNKKLKSVLQPNDGQEDKDNQQQQYLNGLNEERKFLLKSVMQQNKNIRLFCRLRPVLDSEQNEKKYEYKVLSNGFLQLTSGDEHHSIKFDKIFEPNAKQDEIFDCVTPLIRQLLDGYSSCIIAFGLTGSGKTYTIDGDKEENCGIVPRSIKLLFDHFRMQTIFGWKYDLNVSCARIANEKVYDMITDQNEENFQIENLTKKKIPPDGEFPELFHQLRPRNQETNTANYIPSHYMTQLHLTGSRFGQDDKVSSTIHFIDLAGCENIDVSLKEVTKVIKKVQEGNGNVNEGASIITRLLKLGLKENFSSLVIAHLDQLEKKFNVSVKAMQSIINSP